MFSLVLGKWSRQNAVGCRSRRNTARLEVFASRSSHGEQDNRGREYARSCREVYIDSNEASHIRSQSLRVKVDLAFIFDKLSPKILIDFPVLNDRSEVERSILRSLFGLRLA